MSSLQDDGFRRHYDASAFRRDAWARFKQKTTLLKRTARRGSETDGLAQGVADMLLQLQQIERYWCFPGVESCRQLRQLLKRQDYGNLAKHSARLVRLLVTEGYRRQDVPPTEEELLDAEEDQEPRVESHRDRGNRPYFEVLVVDDLDPDEECAVRQKLRDMRREDDAFVYDVVLVSNAEDALIAAQFNHNIQACVLRYSFPFESRTPLEELRDYLASVSTDRARSCTDSERSAELGRILKGLRPELDLFLNTDDPVEEIAGRADADFRRVFYTQEDYLELHLSILKGISERYDTPFFNALRKHSKKPTGVFHALPISRGKSLTRSNWIQDMSQFYGMNIFLAETSATSGGLDSLLQPHGPLKQAQGNAARAFGARRTYFVTNGTSGANKIVMQALCRPGDIVLVSHDCHKSHHYALVLAGAYPIYLDPYPLHEFTLYGAVPLEEMKRRILELRREGKLQRLRMVLLTNCTFDGVVYHPERVMEELLALAPHLIFVWDEAWFAFARFLPLHRKRTAMAAAQTLRRRLKSDAYRQAYAEFRERVDLEDDEACMNERLMPDPDAARVRVYATQSTHKTLTCLRQGSMIHVRDEDFERKAREAFQEAYMTYTSTSPNYQILASLDVGRRQVELEGYEITRQTVELAMLLRERITEHPLLCRHFDVIRVDQMIPDELRQSGMQAYYDPDSGFHKMEDAWLNDEFVLDPARLTLFVGKSGMDGDSFKRLLMDEHDIQINKTSRNTVLFMLTIGTTRGAVAYLVKVLTQIAQRFEEAQEHYSSKEQKLHDARVSLLTEQLPPLPNFSRFHDVFRPDPGGESPEGDLRSAFFLAYDENMIEHVPLTAALAQKVDEGLELVTASFVTPYPPGFPVLVPGQVVSSDIVRYLLALDVKEIHGFEPEFGLRVFTDEALQRAEDSPGVAAAAPEPIELET